ncbi:MAG: polysaccharide biosynthesis protein, partial [Armatimonadota bacterium]
MVRKRGIKWHRLLLLLVDALIVNAVLLLSFWLRFEGSIPGVWWDFYVRVTIVLTPLMLVSSYLFGLNNRVWEYARSEAAVAIVLAVSVATVLSGTVVWLERPTVFSKSIVFMTWAFGVLAIGATRFGWRQIRRHLHSIECARANGERKRALIYGAGQSGASFARRLDVSSETASQVIGFVDDDERLHGMIVSGYRVLGSGEDLPELVSRHRIDQVILATPSASGEELRRMLDHVRESDAEALTLPRLLERVDSDPAPTDVRNVRYEDLLGRALTDIDLELDPNYVEGHTVLVTGAGGSIGSEICRQLCRYHPEELVLLGRGENRIHSIYLALREAAADVRLTPVICNFTNEDHVRRVFRKHRPDVIFHAGAHKHVYLMEQHPTEAARNNVLGTDNLTELAMAFGVKRFIMVSTDKAVDPT